MPLNNYIKATIIKQKYKYINVLKYFEKIVLLTGELICPKTTTLFGVVAQNMLSLQNYKKNYNYYHLYKKWIKTADMQKHNCYF